MMLSGDGFDPLIYNNNVYIGETLLSVLNATENYILAKHYSNIPFQFCNISLKTRSKGYAIMNFTRNTCKLKVFDFKPNSSVVGGEKLFKFFF